MGASEGKVAAVERGYLVEEKGGTVEAKVVGGLEDSGVGRQKERGEMELRVGVKARHREVEKVAGADLGVERGDWEVVGLVQFSLRV